MSEPENSRLTSALRLSLLIGLVFGVLATPPTDASCADDADGSASIDINGGMFFS